MSVATFAAEHPDYYRQEVYDDILYTIGKMATHFRDHNNILVSVSGGSDSDCILHMVCKYFPETLEKVHFVFVNTGLEYAATKRHLTELEQKYGITIERIKGQSVVNVVKKYGVPIFSKWKSHFMSLYLRGKSSGEKYIFREDVTSFHAFKFNDAEKKAAIYCKENKIIISDKCCDLSKKKPLYEYIKRNKCDMNITGERKAEGGQRAAAHKSCFEAGNHGVDKFMPLWWWSDETKAAYKQAEGIRYSDCYEVYGMHRTGCVGCPFNLNVGRDLLVMKQYEPQLFKACMSVFGTAYELTDRFHCRAKPILAGLDQVTMFDVLEGQGDA